MSFQPKALQVGPKALLQNCPCCLSKARSVIGTFRVLQSTRNRRPTRSLKSIGPKLQHWGWSSLKEMFSDRAIPYGEIYPGTGFQQEAPKVGPKASTLGLVVSQRNVQ